MSNGPSAKAGLILLLTGVLGVGALALYVKNTPEAAHVPADIRRVETEAKPTAAVAPSMPAKRPTVHLPKIDGDTVTLDTATEEVPEGSQPMRFVSESVVKAAALTDVRVLGIDVRNHTAIIDFSNSIDAGMGSSQEGTFIRALQVGLGQFPDIKSVQLYRSGEPLESLGHIETVDPLPVIRPGQTEPEAAPKPAEP